MVTIHMAWQRIALAICTVFLFISCGKEKKPATEFTINGLHDVVLEENGSETVEVQVELKSINAEQVHLSVEGAPDGLNLSFNRVTDKPTFTAKLYMKDDSSRAGEYPITLKARSARGTEHTTTFKVTTREKTCALKASGYYRGTCMCKDGSGLIFNDMHFVTDPDDKSKLVFVWQNALIYAIVNCNRNLLTIPLQSTGAYSIHGEGYLDKNYTIISFDYTQYHRNGKEVKCSAHFIRK